MKNELATLIFKNLTFLFFNSTCLQPDSYTIHDLHWSQRLFFYLAFEVGRLNLEEIADVNILLADQNLWSLLSLNKFNFFLMISILITPLLLCLITVAIIFLNQISVHIYGQVGKMEFWDSNFLLFTKAFWRKLWMYAYHYTPRYNYLMDQREDASLLSKVEIKFPNPTHSLQILYNLFTISYWPQPLRLVVYYFLFVILVNSQNLTVLPLLLVIYYLTLYFDSRWESKWWVLGFRFSRLINYFQKKNFFERSDYLEKAHLNSWLSFYPVFFSFFLFLMVTVLLFSLYYEFFFDSIIIWNGYFSKTIVTFFFSSSNLINYPIVFDYFVALDGLNIWLIWLTSLLVYLCALFSLDTIWVQSFFSQIAWIFLLEFASFQFFCVPNYLWMYIFFELSLLPIFVLIVFWGSNRWKIHAAYQMVLFTFIGSMFLLTGIFILFIKVWSFNCFDIFYVTQSEHLNIIFSTFEKKLIWLLLFLGFAVKTPLYPFHIWLPEAHSEAPTTGSVLLAGVLLKMGTYGFLWFVIPLFPAVLETFKTLVFSMSLCGILLSSLAALAQIDIKKIIAYSSIGHMGLVTIGIYTLNTNGLLGASYMMLSHGLVSSALFFSIGILYRIYGTRSLVYYSSLAHFMPRFTMCFFVFSLANMSFPGTAGFPGELLIFASLMADNFFLSLFIGLGSIFGGVYSIWLLTRISYGQISPKISIYWDLKPAEWKILNFLLILILGFGIFPFAILDFLKPMCSFFTALVNT